MKWGKFRIIIFGVAFLFGIWIAGSVDPAVNAGGELKEVAELSPQTGASLVVTCDNGIPTVEQVQGTDGALQVKCTRSQMHVVKMGPSIPVPGPAHPLRVRPAIPFAYLIRGSAVPSE